MTKKKGKPTRPSLIGRVFTQPGEDPYGQVKWRTTDVVIAKPDGSVVFRQDGVEVPEFWSDHAAQVVASKYFRVVDGVRESSVKEMIERVVSTITGAAWRQGLLDDWAPLDTFRDELAHMLLHQMFSFNSPVWFNVGVAEKPQASACFILGVEDTMESIIELQNNEVNIFKGGSGAGSNLSSIRSSREKLSRGGWASGPVSFAKGYDAWAGVTKSGGTTRRAAKMNILNVDHPDILEQRDGTPGFIQAKAHAEQVARDLYSTGKYTAEFNVPGNVYDLVRFQNANLSVRVSDTFMNHVADKKDWWIDAVTDDVSAGRQVYQAHDIWEEIVKAAWVCGDPGLQFDDQINRWHTCPQSGRINASNPCSEFMFLDDSACNLGSLNLLKFWRHAEDFDMKSFEHACRIAIYAMEALVDMSNYPTSEITANSRKFRPLGLGYTNLGALLMAMGLAYDSPEARGFAAAVTASMTGYAYTASAELAKLKGPFAAYPENAEDMLRVIDQHLSEVKRIYKGPYYRSALEALERAYSMGVSAGYRNAQVTLLAPTGTIAFMMDCDTTSGEPALALTTYKKLVGGGTMKIPLRIVEHVLLSLGYGRTDHREAILKHIAANGTVKGAPHLMAHHEKVFQTALGDDPISIDGHLEMMAAQQPFLSGAISKTVNLPENATKEDVARVYWRAWELGLKSVTVYRDGCKLSQPANTKEAKETRPDTPCECKPDLRWGERKRLADTCQSIRHKFTVGGQEGYLFVGLDKDGQPAEIFVEISKEGSTLSGLLNMACISTSIALQHGAPLRTIIDKFRGMKFEPHGFTGNSDIRMVSSLADYIGRWLERTFLQTEAVEPMATALTKTVERGNFSGPPCHKCGNMTQPAGTCYVCAACGETTGCS